MLVRVRSSSHSAETNIEQKKSASKKPNTVNSKVAVVRALIVEDNSSDVTKAASVLNKLGVTEIQAFPRVSTAMEHLRGVVEGRAEVPNVLILDLDFNMESGFEVLRFWKASPKLKGMHVVVWTLMGELEQKVSRLFGVENVVDKQAGVRELEKALRWTLAIGDAS